MHLQNIIVLLVEIVILRGCFFYFVAGQGATTAVASGASFPAGAYKALSFAFEQEVPGHRVEYTPLTSAKGRCRLYNNCPPDDNAEPRQVDWIAVTNPLPESDYLDFPDAHLFPSFAGAVVPIYNLGPDVTNLVLSRSVLARVFRQCSPNSQCPSGWISYWNDSSIAALNPHIPKSLLDEAGRIIVIVWADRAGTTETFKKALALSDPGFATQLAGALSDSADWPNVSYVKSNTNRGVSSRVLATKSSIGYVSLDEAQASRLPHAALGNSFIQKDGLLLANKESVAFALVEKGLNYGNNGDNASHLTADVFGAIGSEAWPLVQLTYFGVREDTLREGSSCEEQRKTTLVWFEWFYGSETVGSILTHLGFAPLPDGGRRRVLELIRQSFKCQGDKVCSDNLTVSDNTTKAPRVLHVRVAEELTQAFDLYSVTFENQAGGIDTKLEQDPSCSPYNDDGVTVVDSAKVVNMTIKEGYTALPLAAVPWGVIYNLCDARLPTPCDPNTVGKADLVLTTEVIADIIAGRISKFNDPRILAVQETNEQRLALPNETIIVTIPPRMSSSLNRFIEILQARELDVPHDGLSLPATFIEATEIRAAQSLVAATQYSLTFSPVNYFSDVSVFRVARLRGEKGNQVLLPTRAAVEACSPSESASQESWTQFGCWPLVESYFLTLPSAFSDELCHTRMPQTIVNYAAFVVSDHVPLRESGMVALDTKAAMESLRKISCFGRSIINLTVDNQYVPTVLIIFVRVLTSLLVFVYILFAIWTCRYRTKLEPNTVFMFETNFGSCLQLLAVYPLTVQDGEMSNTQEMLDIACMAAPWLYVIGLTMVFAPLLAQSWRVRKIFVNPSLEVYHRNEMIQFQVIFFLPILIILILWTVLDPYHWVRKTTAIDPTNGIEVQTTGQCFSEQMPAWLASTLSYWSIGLIGGLVLAYNNRKASGQYILVRNLSLSILILAQALLIGLPMLILVDNIPIASLLVKVIFAYFTAITSTMLLFFPHFLRLSGVRLFSWSQSSNMESLNVS